MPVPARRPLSQKRRRWESWQRQLGRMRRRAGCLSIAATQYALVSPRADRAAKAPFGEAACGEISRRGGSGIRLLRFPWLQDGTADRFHVASVQRLLAGKRGRGRRQGLAAGHCSLVRVGPDVCLRRIRATAGVESSLSSANIARSKLPNCWTSFIATRCQVRGRYAIRDLEYGWSRRKPTGVAPAPDGGLANELRAGPGLDDQLKQLQRWPRLRCRLLSLASGVHPGLRENRREYGGDYVVLLHILS